MFGMLLISILAVSSIAKAFTFPTLPFRDVMNFPLVAFASQIIAYLAMLGFMFTTATQKSGEGFWSAVRWNWPRRWFVYLIAGTIFCIGLQFLARVLPMPKKTGMDVFFQTPLRAWVLSIFGMTLVPFIEEMFFRGFLYPVLARRLGLVLGVLVTAVSFTMIHVPQLADPHMRLAASWGAVLIIFIIGLALTIVRAVKKSVAAGMLMHMAYNGLTSIMAIIVSGGFRHLDRITQ